MVLREEDINFPPTIEQFRQQHHPLLKDLSVESILTELSSAAQANESLAPYLNVVHSLALISAWALEPSKIDYMKAAA